MADERKPKLSNAMTRRSGGGMKDRNDKPCVRVNIPAIPPSLNSALRKHWAKRGEIRDKWRHDIWGSVQRSDAAWLESMATLGKRMKVTIIVRHKQQDDPDNLAFRAKYILDVMKPTRLVRGKFVTGLGFIHDDSKEFIDLDVQQEHMHGWSETVISIAEAVRIEAAE